MKSPTHPSLTEWVACDRPLGIWACIWVVRAILACSLTYWGFLRDRKVYVVLIRTVTAETTECRRQRVTEGRSPGAPTGTSSPHRTSNSHTVVLQNDDEPVGIPAQFGTPPARRARDLPYTVLYSRCVSFLRSIIDPYSIRPRSSLTLLSSLLTLSWFLTAHILEYTSINTCRHSSPHIWWLTFGILCLMYLSILEVILLSFVVFVVAPILFVGSCFRDFFNFILTLFP